MPYPMTIPQYSVSPMMPPMNFRDGGMTSSAQKVQSQGRGNDTMLVHMTPREVGGLQALARANGGSLTINPQTGLPEAGSLDQFLPTLLGVGGAFLGIPPHLTAMAVGGLQTARTGDLGKGIIAGLGAYGGGSMASALGAGSAGAGAAGGIGTASPAATGAEAIGSFTPDYALTAGGSGASSGLGSGFQASLSPLPQATTTAGALTPTATTGLTTNLAPATQVANAVTPPTPSFMDRFAQAAAGPGGEVSSFKTAAAGTGLLTPFIREPQPYTAPVTEEKSTYAGPYTPSERKVSYPDDERRRRSSEFTYFTPSNPVPFAEGGKVREERSYDANDMFAKMNGSISNEPEMAQGGLAALKAGGLREGAFIIPADVISHLGNGSSEAGMKIVKERLNARPIKGPGDGMSDSIPTTIAGRQKARVANEEAEVPPEIVASLGGGSMEKGAKKLYEMMDEVRHARTGKKKQAPQIRADKHVPA